jgi:exodeoxyribonuclease V alpha subunit
MMKLEGFVENIIYRNDENFYTVLEMVADGRMYTCVGTFQFINEGEYVDIEGEETFHADYGKQIRVTHYESRLPADEISMERYLGSGAIKGIGPALAKKIVDRFGADTFTVIEEEPERLSSIKGISEKKALEIASQIIEKKDMRKAMMFLQDFGISLNMAVKVYAHYGMQIYTILRENPYRLADDISGIGFKMADEIAAKAGFLENSEYRIKSAIQYTLSAATGNGHVYLPKEELYNGVVSLLGMQIAEFDQLLMDLMMEKKIVVKNSESGTIVYAAMYYHMEAAVAARLKDLNVSYAASDESIEGYIRKIEKNTDMELDSMQRMAVAEAARNGLLVITGGPGTGKTTTINAIIRFFEMEQMEIALAAPTGRAAKRMTETTGMEAKTIHRLLELSGGPQEDGKANFERNEMNPLEADVVIIDEMSMVDIMLMNSLLKAVAVGTRVILVGDENQLPSVGPGNVLKDIIHSECFNVVKLTKIFRQAQTSEIIVNAHKINAGEEIVLNKYSKDFLFLHRDNANAIISAMLTLIREKLPAYVKADMSEIQVLAPARKGILGVEQLNKVLQEYLNPKDSSKAEKEYGDGLFREGDKVMQIRNNYQLEWEIRGGYGSTQEKGTGVFNGDIGTITHISTYASEVTVEFDEGRVVTYPFAQLDELELAYAITIHKSQGSEYPAVIIPMAGGPRMLMTRNILYTGVTRAKTCVCLVGMENIFHQMIETANEQKRYSTLALRIQEMY